jgi:hypothetical protein
LFKGINAEEAWKELHGNGEKRTPQEIVDIARNPNSVIHNYFQWDDGIAAEEYRKGQAARMERSFVLTKVVDDGEKVEKKIYRLVEVDSSRTSVYTPVIFTLRKEDEYADLLRRAKIELEGFVKRYHSLIELQEIIEDIELLLAV